MKWEGRWLLGLRTYSFLGLQDLSHNLPPVSQNAKKLGAMQGTLGDPPTPDNA